MILIPLAACATAAADEKADDKWEIEIIPNPPRNAIIKAADDKPADKCNRGNEYERIYQGVPFIRTEFEANPAYRHQLTLAIMFGQPPQIINQTQTAPAPRLSGYYFPPSYIGWNTPFFFYRGGYRYNYWNGKPLFRRGF